jgi:transposase
MGFEDEVERSFGRPCRQTNGRSKRTCELNLQASHRVRERLVSQRTGIINQIRAFLLERGVAVRQGLRFLRAELPRILATPPDVLSARMVRVIKDLAEDWRRLDERIDDLSNEIAVLARHDAGCERLMSAMVAAIGTAMRSPKAVTSPRGWALYPSRSRPGPHHPWQDIEEG